MLGDFRETCALLAAFVENAGLRLLMATTIAISTREVEVAVNEVDSGSLGSIISVSVSETTGASKLTGFTHDL